LSAGKAHKKPREAPQAEQVIERGRLSAAAMPTWPHGHVTRISMELHQKIAPAIRG
jgi:hypothetical protein